MNDTSKTIPFGRTIKTMYTGQESITWRITTLGLKPTVDLDTSKQKEIVEIKSDQNNPIEKPLSPLEDNNNYIYWR